MAKQRKKKTEWLGVSWQAAPGVGLSVTPHHRSGTATVRLEAAVRPQEAARMLNVMAAIYSQLAAELRRCES